MADRPCVDDPGGAAGACEGMGTDRRHVFAEHPWPVGEHLRDLRGDCDGPLRKIGDQTGEKCSRALGRSINDLRIKVFRNLLDGEEDRNDHAEDVVVKDDFIGGDFNLNSAVEAFSGG